MNAVNFEHLGSITAFLSAAALLATMGMNAYGAMLTVLTGVDSIVPIKPGRLWRVVTIIALAVLWYVIAHSVSTDNVTKVFMILFNMGGFSYTGWFPRHVTNGVDYAWLVGLAVSGVVYYVLSLSIDTASEGPPSPRASENCKPSRWPPRRTRPARNRLVRAAVSSGPHLPAPHRSWLDERPPVKTSRNALDRGVAGMTVGVAERYFFEHTQADIVSRVRAAVDVLRDAGAHVTEVDLGWPAPGDEDFYLSEEGAAVGDHWPSRRADLGADVVRELDAATRLTGVDAGRARQRRIEYQAQTEERLRSDGVDLIVTPTQALSPPLIGATTASFAGNPNEDVTAAMLGMTAVFNALGWPAISVPCGTDAMGLPIGIQIAALPWREADCLAAAAVLAI